MEEIPVAHLGYRYAITIIDYHTGWAEVYPTRDQSAREIVRVFAEEFMPRCLDRGPPKTAKSPDEVAKSDDPPTQVPMYEIRDQRRSQLILSQLKTNYL